VKEVVNNTGPLSAPRPVSVKGALGVAASLRLHWPEYLMEAGEMGLYLFCICSFATLLRHPLLRSDIFSSAASSAAR